MKLIDCHTHAFPDVLAQRAMQSLVKTSNINPFTNGTVQELINLEQNCGVSAAVVCNIATNAKQQTNVNNFAKSINNKKDNNVKILSVGSVHPLCQDIDGAVKDIKNSGLYGIKIHPDYVSTHFNDEAFFGIFEAAQKYNLPVITHAGFDPISPEHYHCTPKMLLEIHKMFPKLKIVAAHMGSNKLCKDVLKYICGQDIYIDTSMLHQNDLYLVREILINHNPQKILFGSDAPWGSPLKQWQIICNLNLPNTLLNNIAYKNAEDLFNIKSLG